jgi:hypothetical protein
LLSPIWERWIKVPLQGGGGNGIIAGSILPHANPFSIPDSVHYNIVGIAFRAPKLSVYTALGHKLRFFEKAESAIFDRGYYIMEWLLKFHHSIRPGELP